MNPLIKILLFNILLVFQVVGYTQPVINERYEIGGETNSIFGSVIATDSCYYVTGVHLSSSDPSKKKGSFAKVNLDGSINFLSSIENDTMGYDLWQGLNLIKTLDDNFAAIAIAKGENSHSAFSFIKISPTGDTLFTKYYYDFFENDFSIGKSPLDLIQNPDSSYYGLVRMQRDTDLLSGVTFFKLDKLGNLLYWKNYYGLSITGYHSMRGGSLIKLNEDELLIGGSLQKLFGYPTEDKRKHTKLIKIDVLGNILDEYTYYDDDLSASCYGLKKTVDDGVLYCGTNGQYFSESNVIGYRGRIVKLNSDYEVDWELELGDFRDETNVSLFEIMALSDSEFVAVGWNKIPERKFGWLVKFNLDGDVLWERKYIKIPPFGIELATHILYDIDITSDEGFVMTGQSTNYYITEDLPGQKAWLLKSDKHGCLVPNCHLVGVEIEPIDTGDTTVYPPPPPKEDPILWLYPNPASNNLFYYHHQDIFQFGTAYIYSPTGAIVQKWEITENDITYEVDVSRLSEGTYFVKVFNMLGEPIQTESFVKI